MSTLEQRISALDRENKARKVIYPVVGSLVKFVAQTSQVWTVASASITTLYRFQFQVAKFGNNGKTMTYLTPQVNLANDFTGQMINVTYSNEPQPGDGTIVVKFHLPATVTSSTVYIRVVATGPSTGTFTKL